MTKQQDLMKNSLIKEISNAYIHYIKPFSNQADVIVSSVLSAFHAFSYHHVNYEKVFYHKHEGIVKLSRGLCGNVSRFNFDQLISEPISNCLIIKPLETPATFPVLPVA